jgi:hypothetical protein
MNAYCMISGFCNEVDEICIQVCISARATTKISLVAKQYPLTVTARCGFLRGWEEGRGGIYHKCQLPNAQSPFGRKCQSKCNEHFTTNHITRGKNKWVPTEEEKTIKDLLIIIVEKKKVN